MTETKRPLILISNDDGADWPGIRALTRVARTLGDVVVAAPTQHQSGMSSSITIKNPLRTTLVKKLEGFDKYAVAGTPVDCVKISLNALLGGRKPDILLSGINHGQNIGVSTAYSGTVGVALEGAVHHIPSVAFSIDDYNPKGSLLYCLPMVEEIIKKVLEKGLPDGVCLNVNFPQGPIKGIKATKTAMGRWDNEYDHRVDPAGKDYYWLQGTYTCDNPDDTTTDHYWLSQGYATATPVRVDPTAHSAINHVESLLDF